MGVSDGPVTFALDLTRQIHRPPSVMSREISGFFLWKEIQTDLQGLRGTKGGQTGFDPYVFNEVVVIFQRLTTATRGNRSPRTDCHRKSSFRIALAMDDDHGTRTFNFGPPAAGETFLGEFNTRYISALARELTRSTLHNAETDARRAFLVTVDRAGIIMPGVVRKGLSYRADGMRLSRCQAFAEFLYHPTQVENPPVAEITTQGKRRDRTFVSLILMSAGRCDSQ